MIRSTVDNVWSAMVDPKVIDDWGGGPAQMDENVGTKFKLWGGDIWGSNIEVEPKRKLVQQWYGGQWEKPSVVTFEFVPRKNQTLIKLTHKNIPDNEFDQIADGWKKYYLGPMKELLEK